MRKLFKYCLLPAIIFFAITSSAQDRTAKLDSIFNGLFQKGNFNGNVLIAEKGTPVYLRSFGLANETTGEKLDENSVFELASVSKQFTAMAIALLNKQGKLKFDDPVTKTIPEFSFYKPVTIRQLLHHVSGLPDYMALFESVWNKKTIANNDDIITLFAKHKPALLFEPGSKWEYSNTGYAVLSTIIERVSKTSYANFLEQQIFKPLQMKNTLVYTRRYKPQTVKNYAYGYVYDNQRKKVLPDSLEHTNMVYWLDGITGDGTVNSTVKDLLIWDRALYTEKLLSKSELDEVFRPGILTNGMSTNYGFGWLIENNKDFGKIAYHSGGWPGYMTFIERDLDKDRTIIILQNGEGKPLPLKSIRNILYNKPVAETAVKPSTELVLADSILVQYEGEFELVPGFSITVTKEGSKLMAQATNQSTVELFASAKDKFFLKVVEASIDFIRNEKDEVVKLILHQGGRDMEGLKK